MSLIFCSIIELGYNNWLISTFHFNVPS